MSFQELINEYISKINCSVKDLANASGLSIATISRYKSGERKPFSDSLQFEKLVNGLLTIDAEKELFLLDRDVVTKDLLNSLNVKQNQNEIFSKNFNILVDLLQINMKDLANAINFEISYLYRIRQGQRHPHELDKFTDLFCTYVSDNLHDKTHKEAISKYLQIDVQDIDTSDAYYSSIKKALFLENNADNLRMSSFLTKLNDFNLDEFIRSIHFDELKVPTVPFALPASKNYYGVEQMRKGELDFFKATVLSNSKESIFMCSDMPMSDMAKDMDFNKKWMFGIAASLKKGLHLDIIHNIDRPFDELMLGLEAWIPIYMTGQISPYHLKDVSTDVYHHFTYVSGAAALSGECIDGFYENGKYHLTNSKEDINYYRKRANNLLQKATPLMEIYTVSEKNKFEAFMDSLQQIHEDSRNIRSSLPLYTMSQELLLKILDASSISEVEKQAILDFHQKELGIIQHILAENEIIDEIPDITQEEFDHFPVCLSLSGFFPSKEIKYTYEHYLEHLEQTKRFASQYEFYTLKSSSNAVFRNIQIHIIGDKQVVISKNTTPTIHFVIRHPKMVNAISQFVAPVI